VAFPLETPAAATDLISFLKALPDCRMRRGIRYPQWWMLLVAILAILSNQGSLMGMKRFAKRHRQTLNELLGTQVAKPPSDTPSGSCSRSWTCRALEACSRTGGAPRSATPNPWTTWSVAARRSGVESIRSRLGQRGSSLR
jgi:hypothetical protein